MLRFPGLDAAILLSDILVIAGALGQGYTFRESGGIAMSYEVAQSPSESLGERLRYVAQALSMLRSELQGSKALLGFGSLDL